MWVKSKMSDQNKILISVLTHLYQLLLDIFTYLWSFGPRSEAVPNVSSSPQSPYNLQTFKILSLECGSFIKKACTF